MNRNVTNEFTFLSHLSFFSTLDKTVKAEKAGVTWKPAYFTEPMGSFPRLSHKNLNAGQPQQYGNKLQQGSVRKDLDCFCVRPK